jgi:predicted component of type VI protein secretion system
VGKLVHLQADGSPLEVKLDRQRITIGRRPDNDVCLPYPAVSGEHAVIVTILDDSFLEDLGSTNGTLVNGAAVAKYFLRDRDEIDVGRHVLVYCADDAATVEPPRVRGSADGAARGKRRADVVPHRAAGAGEPLVASTVALDSSSGFEVTAEFPRSIESNATEAEVGAALAAPSRPPYRFVDGEPALKVMSGAKAGRIVALVKDETLIGRTGVQVVAFRRVQDEVRMVPIEGATPPSVNGVRVLPEGQSLALGDILEVAGAKLEVIAPTKRPSA